jgi:hypothetical protein
MKIILRILVLPAFLFIALVFLLKKIAVMSYKFVRYGGELIHYDMDVNPVTIAEVYEKIRNQEFISTE